MDTEFKATHIVVKEEAGWMVFIVGEQLQSIVDGYYKSQYGHHKFVPDAYLSKIKGEQA